MPQSFTGKLPSPSKDTNFPLLQVCFHPGLESAIRRHLCMENSKAEQILKFLKYHILSVNLETNFKESNRILPKFILLRSLHTTFNLSHHYSLLAEEIQDLSRIHTEKLTNISLISRICCRCSKFLEKKKTKMNSFFPDILLMNGNILPSYQYKSHS